MFPHIKIGLVVTILLCTGFADGILFARSAPKGTPIEADAPRKTEEKAVAIPLEETGKTRPVFIAYGLGYRNIEFLMDSLHDIKAALAQNGIPAFITEKEAFASIETNARIMRRELLAYLADHPEFTKVDIIAHSKGGLEARYMITNLGMAGHVASLTTLATPHRGSPVAEFLLEAAGEGGSTVASVVADIIGILLGDRDPDSDAALTQLTPEYLKNFNARTPDHPDVYYLSYAVQLGDSYPSLLYRTLGRAVYETAGPNDGLVPVESAIWGDFGGLACKLYGHSGLSHSDIIGGNPLTRNVNFDYTGFFFDIVQKVQSR